jgi:hypothetical protein
LLSFEVCLKVEGVLRVRRKDVLARGVIFALWLLLGAPVAMAQQATLVGDAHVSALQPAVNSGSLSNLDVGNGYTALMQFDLGVLPPGTTAVQITRATLRVYCNRADTPGAVSIAAVNGSWAESTVTYATVPTVGAAVASATATAGSYVTFDGDKSGFELWPGAECRIGGGAV